MAQLDGENYSPEISLATLANNSTGIVTIDQLPINKTLSKNDWLVLCSYTTKQTGKSNLTQVMDLLKGDFYTKADIINLLKTTQLGFTPIFKNQVGNHPAFANQNDFNLFLLKYILGGGVEIPVEVIGFDYVLDFKLG